MRLHKCGQSPSLCQSPERAKPPRPAGFSSITPLPQPGAQTGRIAVGSISLPLFLFHSERMPCSSRRTGSGIPRMSLSFDLDLS